MKEFVAEVIETIRNEQDDDRLQRIGPGKIKLQTCELFPNGSAYRMTLEARRKAFRPLVASVLIAEGWERLGNDLFERRRQWN